MGWFLNKLQPLQRRRKTASSSYGRRRMWGLVRTCGETSLPHTIYTGHWRAVRRCDMPRALRVFERGRTPTGGNTLDIAIKCRYLGD